MKIVRSSEMSRIEQLAYDDGASEESFMEQAGAGIADYALDFIDSYPVVEQVVLLCGRGNNGGDAYVAGRYLLEQDIPVFAIQAETVETGSPLLQKNAKRFTEAGGRIIDTVPLGEETLLLDGLFGTGFRGQAEEPYASLIRAANSSEASVLAIDVPSGLNGNDGRVEGAAIYAQQTLCLGLPKLGLFSRSGWERCGKLAVIPFGLDDSYIDAAEASCELLTRGSVPKLPKLNRCQHKYEAGFIQVLAGSPNMPGAGVLTAHAALRSGAGIVHLLHPENTTHALVAAPAEIIRVPIDPLNDRPLVERLNKASAVVMGPGLGTDSAVQAMIRGLLPKLSVPLVLDADALNSIAAIRLPPPKGSLLTPHEGEMSRLLGGADCTPAAVQEYAKAHEVCVILKGAPSHMFGPSGSHWVCPLGNPGMATAGAGDVLSGLLAALLGKGMSVTDAARLGVYLHALAGDCAESGLSPYCMLASDITEHLPQAFQILS